MPYRGEKLARKAYDEMDLFTRARNRYAAKSLEHWPKGRTRSEVLREIKINPQRYEQGIFNGLPRPAYCLAVCRFLNVSLDYMLFDEWDLPTYSEQNIDVNGVYALFIRARAYHANRFGLTVETMVKHLKRESVPRWPTLLMYKLEFGISIDFFISDILHGEG